MSMGLLRKNIFVEIKLRHGRLETCGSSDHTLSIPFGANLSNCLEGFLT